MTPNYGYLTYNEAIDYIYGNGNLANEKLEALLIYLANQFDFYDPINFKYINLYFQHPRSMLDSDYLVQKAFGYTFN